MSVSTRVAPSESAEAAVVLLGTNPSPPMRLACLLNGSVPLGVADGTHAVT